MFSLEISAVLNRIKEVKVRVGVSSSKDGSLDEGTGLFHDWSSEGGRKNLADENPMRASNAGIISKSEAVKKVYKLEMDERGRTLSFKCVLNSEESTRRKPLEQLPPPPPFKRARTSNLSSSVANYEPSPHRGGAQELKFNKDATRDSRDLKPVARKVEDLSANLPRLPSLNRIYDLNENEEEEDAWLSSTSKPPVSYKMQSRKKSMVVYEGGRNPLEKTEVHSSILGLKDGIVAHGFHEKVTRELLVQKNDSSIKQEPKPQPHTDFISRAIALLPEPKDGSLARESQEISPEKRRERKADNTENTKTSDMKPSIFKAVKAEVNLKEEESSNFPLFIPGNDGIQPESNGLVLIKNPNSIVGPCSEHAADNSSDKESPSRFLNLVRKTDPPTHGSNEEDQVAVVGVTEDELIDALLASGLSIKIDELVLKFGDRVDTIEAQNAFLQLLKRNCIPEMKEEEMYLVLHRR